MGNTSKRALAITPPPTTKTIGYIRVSTQEQDVEKNKADILMLVHKRQLSPVTFETEKASGTKAWRERDLGRIINSLNKGDCLVVPEMSRLGRSMMDIMDVLKVLADKEVKVYAVKGDWQLDDSLQSKVMAAIFAIAAEIERDLISARTKEALKARKAAGITLGRPKGKGKSKLDQYKVEIEALLVNGTTKTFIAKRYGTTLPNLYNWIKRNKAA